jgi:hypothetical protein
LHGVFRIVEIGLLHLYRLPIHIQFFGDQHRQHGLDALPDFRILGHDGDRAVRIDLDKVVRHLRRPRPELRGGFLRFGGQAQKQAAARERTHA